MRKTLCNMCGKEMDAIDERSGGRFYKLLGYGSKYDGDTLELDICCSCLDRLVDMCKISPIKETAEECPRIFERGGFVLT